MKRIIFSGLLLLLGLVSLVALGAEGASAQQAKITPGPIKGLPIKTSVIFPSQVRLDVTSNANEFKFIKLNGLYNNTIPLDANSVNFDFSINANGSSFLPVCSFTYITGYADPVGNFLGATAGVPVLLYKSPGRTGGGRDVLLNPQRKDGGGMWVFSTCPLNLTLYFTGYN